MAQILWFIWSMGTTDPLASKLADAVQPWNTSRPAVTSWPAWPREPDMA